MKKATVFTLCLLSACAFQQLSGMRLSEALTHAQGYPEELARIARDAHPRLLDEALSHASQRNQTLVVAALLAAGANPNYIGQDNFTPLSLSCTRLFGGDGACIPLLLDGKADVNLHLSFPKADPALRRAIRCQNFAALPRLIAAGADTSSALEWAQENYRESRAISNECPSNLHLTKQAAEIVAFFEKIARPAAQVIAQAAPAPGQENKEQEEYAAPLFDVH